MSLKKSDIVYYARIFPMLGIYEVEELKVRTVKEDYFVTVEKRTKRSYLFGYDVIGEDVFIERKDALAKVKLAEKNKKPISTETYYEEY